MLRVILLLSYTFNCYCYGDWVSDWMSPLQQEIKYHQEQKIDDFQNLNLYNEDQMIKNNEDIYDIYSESNHDSSSVGLKDKLKSFVNYVKRLAEVIQKQITVINSRETMLKDSIINGRHGIATVKVTIANRRPRHYVIRDGLWTYCDGYIQAPNRQLRKNLFSDMFSMPKCVGQEVITRRDPCAYNSIIKYETLPDHKMADYKEDDYLCVKYSFNSTMEQYLSVPKKTVNATCQTGVVKSLQENIEECGVRTLSEYTFYPYKSTARSLPMEYCTKENGCKLLIGWHMANGSINNFEYLKDDSNFKDYFIRNGASEHISI